MKIETTQFGTLQVNEQDVMEFPGGVPGFEECQQFVLIQPDKTLPFAYLQSVQEPDVSLMVADPFAFYKDYEFDLSEGDLRALQDPTPEQITVWVTTFVVENLQEATVNLMAPIVFNTAKRRGRQVILHDSGYQSKTPLFGQAKEEK